MEVEQLTPCLNMGELSEGEPGAEFVRIHEGFGLAPVERKKQELSPTRRFPLPPVGSQYRLHTTQSPLRDWGQQLGPGRAWSASYPSTRTGVEGASQP